MVPSSIKLFVYKVKLRLTLEFNSLYDKFLYQLNIADKSLYAGKGKRVIFLGEYLPSRISRIAKYVKRTSNYSTVLVALKSGTKEKHNTEVFDETVLFRNKWHLKRILRNLQSEDIVHAFGPPCLYPAVVLDSVKNPMFYDIQDTQVINYGKNPPLGYLQRDLKNEIKCFEECVGLVSHSIEPQYVKKVYDMPSSPRYHYFPNYCDNDHLIEAPHKSIEELHIVYAGSVHGKHRDKMHFGTTQFHEKIEQLAAQKIHFHVYPSPLQPEMDYDDYRKIDKVNPYFHYHEPVHQNDLTKELSQYHFGFLPFFNEDHGRQPHKFVYSTSLKLFNYIEAGIPVIISDSHWFQQWILMRYSSGIVIKKSDIPKLSDIIGKYDYFQKQQEIYQKRKNILLGDKIQRLISWYDATGQ